MNNSSKMHTCQLLGVRFHALTRKQLIGYLVSAAQRRQKTVVAHVNIHAMNIAFEQTGFRDFLNQADLVSCDGFGVLLGARLMGYPVRACHRITCPDYIEDLARACEQQQVSLFLLADKAGVVDTAIAKLKRVAPQLRIAGHHGYFDKTGPENDRVIDLINAFAPGILYLGFGMPLQERWIVENSDRVAAGVFLPLGACLDFYTGAVYRGPVWLTNHGFEWFTRLMTEPRRLWRRYLVGNPLFLWRVLKQRWGLLHFE